MYIPQNNGKLEINKVVVGKIITSVRDLYPAITVWPYRVPEDAGLSWLRR